MLKRLLPLAAIILFAACNTSDGGAQPTQAPTAAPRPTAQAASTAAPASPTQTGGAQGYIFVSDNAAGQGGATGDNFAHDGFLLSRTETAPTGYRPLSNTAVTVSDAIYDGEPPAVDVTAKTDAKGFVAISGLTAGRKYLKIPTTSGKTVRFPLTAIGGATVLWGQPAVTRSAALAKAQDAVKDFIRQGDTYILSPQTPVPAGVEVAPALGNDDGVIDP